MPTRPWIAKLFAGRTTRPAPTPRPRTRLGVEGLEDRTVPTTLTPTVFTDGGAGSSSLRAAVIAANADAGTAPVTINLGAGTYSLTLPNAGGVQEGSAATGDLDVTSTAHKLIIWGATSNSGAPATTIDAGALADRVFQIVNPGTSVEFHNLVITRGLAQDNGAAGASPRTTGSPGNPGPAEGGGVLNGGGNLAFTNVVFDSNAAQGAPYFAINSGGTLIEADAQDARGGAVDTSGGTVTFSDCTFSNNAAQGGRGANYQRFINSTNAAGAGQGGGLYAAAGQVLVTDTTFDFNRALGGRNYQYLYGNDGRAGVGQGGGIFSAATLTVTNDTFASNAALGGDEGTFLAGSGGYWVWQGSTPSSGYGGGLFAGGGAATLTATTFAGNSAYGGYGFDGVIGAPIRALGFGGGLLNQGAQVTLVDSILTANLAGDGGGVSNHQYNNQPPPSLAPSGGTEQDLVNTAGSLAGHHDLIRDGSGGLGDTITADPMLAPLANYGGPTRTLAPLPGSPALGAGTAVAGVTTDQRGAARTGRVDIGAFQSRGFNVAAGGGAGQSTYVGTTFAAPLTATVSSAFGEPVAGGRVTFTAAPSAAGASAGLSASVVTIAADGSASVTATANPTAGTSQVTATTGTATVAAASFSLINTLAPTLLTPATFGDNPYSTSLRGVVVAFNHDPDAADHTINLGSGTYRLTLGDLAVTSTAHTLVIHGQGVSGPGATVIDAGGLSRIFRVVNPGTTVRFDNLVITHGRAAQGGGVYNGGGNLAFSNVVFDANTAQGANGTGYDPYGGDAAAGEDGSGGGLYSAGGSVSIADSTFSSNKAVGGKGEYGLSGLYGGPGGTGHGGGFYAGGGSVTIARSMFVADSAVGGQGGDSSPYVSSRTPGGIGGVGRGGGGQIGGGTAAITNSTFASDSAVGGAGGRGSAAGSNIFAGHGGSGGPSQGGGLYSTGSATVTNATFSSTALGGAGGAGGAAGTVYPAGPSGTAGTAQGGGLDVGGGSTTLNNSIVAGTTGKEAVTSGGTLSGSTNLIQDGSGGLAGTIVANPLLGALANNGGPTQTMALLPGSPAINAGTNAAANLPATDQRGTGFARILGVTVDIGAYESQTQAPVTIPTTTAVASSAASSTYGGSVTFTATVTGTSTPTGGVMFVIGTGAPVAGIAGATTGTTATWTYTTAALNAGTHAVQVLYAGTGSFTGSNGTLSGGQVVNKANAAVVVTPYTGTYDGSPHAAAVASITGVNGETGAAVGTVTLSPAHTDAGTYTDSWGFAGGANYNDIPATAITNVIAKAASAVAVTVVGGPFTYTGAAQTPAAVTVTGAGGLSLTPTATYASNVDAGTATASFGYAGDANHEASSGSATFAINMANAVFTITAYSGIYDGGAHGISGSAAGVEATPANLTGLLHLGGTFTNAPGGTATWTFDGNGNYNSATGTAAVTITKASSTVTATGGAFTYDNTARAGSGSVDVSGGSVTLSYLGTNGTVYSAATAPTNAGTYTVTATYPGDANHSGSSASAALTINKASSTTTTVGAGPFTYTGGTQAGGSGTVTGAGGLSTAATSLTYTGDQVDVGTYYVTAHYAGDANHTASDGAAVLITIAKASSTTTTLGAAPFTYTDGVNAGGSGTVTGAGGLNTAATFLTYSGDRVNAGTYTVTAHYAGDANHLPSDGAAVAITIDKAATTTVLTVVGGPFTYTGAAQTPAAVTVTGAGGLSLTPTATYASNVDAGTATASFSYAGDANHEASSGSATFAISKADATVTVTPYTVTYDGRAHSAAVSTITGVDGEAGAAVGAVTLNTTHTNAGTYSDSWSFAGTANYNGIASAAITNVITKAALTITANNDTKVYGTLKTFGGTAFTQTGLVGGDAVTGVTETSPGAATAAAVGTYAIVPGAATGTGLGSYDITYVNGALTVFPALTVPAAQTAYEDADKPIGGISISAALGGTLSLTLGVGHGALTLGTTGGLTVSGNGTGSVTLTGTTAALNAALASLVYRGGLNFSGADTLSLTLGDGGFSSTASVAITVVSAAQQAVDLQARVTALRTAGVLNQGQANSLIVKLDLHGNNGDAGKVRAFLNQVQAYLNAGILTQAQADTLLGPGNTLLLSVTRR